MDHARDGSLSWCRVLTDGLHAIPLLVLPRGYHRSKRRGCFRAHEYRAHRLSDSVRIEPRRGEEITSRRAGQICRGIPELFDGKMNDTGE